MKKCPKCGTILDDSKKQCYMCGTNLEPNKVDITENKSIGAIVSSQTQPKPKFGGADAEVEKTEKKSFFNQDKDDLNSLNAAPADKRSALQKGFDSIFGNKKFKEKTEIPKPKKEKKPIGKKEEVKPKGPQARKNVMDVTPNEPEPNKEDFSTSKKSPFEEKNVITQMDDGFGKGKKEEPTPEPEEKNVINQMTETKPKKDIASKVPEEDNNKATSFGFLNDASNEPEMNKTGKHDFGFSNAEEKIDDKEYEFHAYKPSFMDKVKQGIGNVVPKKTRGYKDGRQEFRFTGQTFINIIAIIFFIGVIYYVWNFVINKKVDNTLSGLVYDINSDFKLKSKDKLSRYYEYNQNCTIKITTDKNKSVDSYLDNVKDIYGSDDSATVQYEQLKIHSNIWSSVAIVYFPKDSTAIGGSSLIPRYRYTSIEHKGDFFAIIFVNTYEDKSCQSMYDEFSKSLNFKEG